MKKGAGSISEAVGGYFSEGTLRRFAPRSGQCESGGEGECESGGEGECEREGEGDGGCYSPRVRTTPFS